MWEQQSVFAWLRSHCKEEIFIVQQGTALRVQGVCAEMENRDACSQEVLSGALDLGIQGAWIELSLHLHGISLHLLLNDIQGSRSCSVPVSLPYSHLHLGTLAEEERVRKEAKEEVEQAALRKKAEEDAFFNPYELFVRHG